MNNFTYKEAFNKEIIFQEFQYALNNTQKKDLIKLAKNIPTLLYISAYARIKSTKLTLNVLKNVALKQYQLINDRKINYLKQDIPNNIRIFFNDLENIIKFLKLSIIEDPNRMLIKVFTYFLGFYIGSGGLDGDGGVPDLDIDLFGIGSHRSIFTHSVIAGIFIDFLLLMFLSIVKLVYKNLPANHNPFWDKLINSSEDVLKDLSIGISIGLSYHFGIDSIIDSGGNYKDLPISLPHHIHNIILLSNSIIEGSTGIVKYKYKFFYKELIKRFKDGYMYTKSIKTKHQLFRKR